MTEDSRNHMRGYGSFPEGAEPTEEIAAFGDPTAELPTSRSSARPSIPSQPPTPAAARPSRPWSAPPPAFARPGVSYAEPPAITQPPTITQPPATTQPQTTAEPQMVAEPFDGLSSPVRRPLYGGIRRASVESPGGVRGGSVESPGGARGGSVEPPSGVRPASVEPSGGARRATVEPPGAVRPMTIEPPGAVRRATVEPPGDVQPLIIERPTLVEPDPRHDEPVELPSEAYPDFDAPSGDVRAPQAAAEPDGEYPVWPASVERPEGHRPAPPPAKPAPLPWDPAATGWPDEPPADAGSRPEAAAEEFAYPASAPPGPFFAPTRSNPGEEWSPEPHAPSSEAYAASSEAYATSSEAHAASSDAHAPSSEWSPEPHAPVGDWSHDAPHAPSGDWSHDAPHAPSGDPSPGTGPTPDPWTARPPDPTPARHDQPHTEDPHGLPATPSRRITPTPPTPHPTRLFAGLLIGLLIGLLLFGAAGWFTGRATAPKAIAPTSTAPANPAKPATGLFEQTQATLNAAHFKDTGLTKLAQPWLPYLANCAKATPAQADGEKARVRCTIDGMSAFFVEYKSTAERDKARGKLQPQVRDASTLAPGAKTPGKIAEGNYVEYAYRLTEGGVTRTVAGIWWDDAQTPIAAYLLAYWKDGLGERWEPMRDLWSRYA